MSKETQEKLLNLPVDLTITVQEAQYIVNTLSEKPWFEVNELITKISKLGKEVVAEATSSKIESDEDTEIKEADTN